MDLDTWRQSGTWLDIDDRELFVVQSKARNPDTAPTLCFLHGFPSSSHDFHACFRELRDEYNLVAHDHPGFGLSEKPLHYSYSLIEQAECALRLWQELGLSRVHVVAHDYGTSVLTEILARARVQPLPVSLDSITVANGSVHIELARLRLLQYLLRRPWLGPATARLSNYFLFKRNMKKIWGEPGQLDDETVRAMWDGLLARSGRDVLARVSRYTLERSLFWYRWITALRTTRIPAHILWADRDPVAVPAIARALQEDMPHARMSWLNGLGHYPMLEAPQRFSAGVRDGIEARQQP